MTHLSSAIIILSVSANGEEERHELHRKLVHALNEEAGDVDGHPCKVARHILMKKFGLQHHKHGD